MANHGSASSAAGGRSNWQGLRFEAAFAALNILRTAMGDHPVGFTPELHRTQATLRYRPQADGAVDDLVALDGETRLIAYQLKSSSAQLPRTSATMSPTMDAFRQAAAEFADVAGARVVVLVFSAASGPVRVVADWLDGRPTAQPSPTSIEILSDVLGRDIRSLRAGASDRQLRLVEAYNTADLAAQIEVLLGVAYASSTDRSAASDALLALIAAHSDHDGAQLPPIDTNLVRQHLASRGLAPLTVAERTHRARPILERVMNRFLLEVAEVRGMVPHMPRKELVARLRQLLSLRDLALLGPGGAGKTELLARLVEGYLSDGWLPLIVRRDDISAGPDGVAQLVGGGGRTTVGELLRTLVSEGSHRGVCLVVDGLDEVRRAGERGGSPARALVYDLVVNLRVIFPEREKLHVVVACRDSDWKAVVGDAPGGREYETFLVPPLSTGDIGMACEADAALRDVMSSVPDSLVGLIRETPILLRLALDIYASGAGIGDLRTPVALWNRYYSEVVCAGIDVSADRVAACHAQLAREHGHEGVFSFELSTARARETHPHELKWLRSIGVVRNSGNSLEDVRFFHPTYADYALARLIADDAEACVHWRRAIGLAIPGLPAWRLVPSFLAGTANAVPKTRAIVHDDRGCALSRVTVVGSWAKLQSCDEFTQVARLIIERPSIAIHFIRCATEHALRVVGGAGSLNSVLWSVVSHRLRTIEPIVLDTYIDCVLRLLEANGRDEQAIWAWPIVERAWAIANELATSPVGLSNARVLSRAAARLASFAAAGRWFDSFPVEAEAWQLPDPVARTFVAAAVRDAFVETEVICRLSQRAPTETRALLDRIISAAPADVDAIGSINVPMQTSVTLIESTRDAWAGALHSLSSSIARLVAIDPYVVDVAVHAHEISMDVRGTIAGDSGSLDEGYDGVGGDGHDPWMTIARTAFNEIVTIAVAGNTAGFDRLVDIMARKNAVFIERIIVDVSARIASVESTSRMVRYHVASAALSIVAKWLNGPSSVGDLDGVRIAKLVGAASDGERGTVFDALRTMYDPGVLASEPIADIPDLERLRQAERERVSELESRQRASTSPDPTVAIELSILRAYPADARHAIAVENHAKRVQEAAIAARGDIPEAHPSVVRCLDIVAALVAEQVELPQDLDRFYRDRAKELPERRMPAFIKMSRESDDGYDAGDERSETSARLVHDMNSILRGSRNRTERWQSAEVSTVRRLLGDGATRIASGETTATSFKVTWLAVLERGLALAAEVDLAELPPIIVDLLIELSFDADPAEDPPVTFVDPQTVRGRAATALAQYARVRESLNAAKRFAEMRHDPCGSVRWAVYWSAESIHDVSRSSWEEIVRHCAQSEQDTSLLGHIAVVSRLLISGLRDAELRVIDEACAMLLERAMGSPIRGRFTDEQMDNFIRNIVEPVGYLAHSGSPRTTATVSKVIRSSDIRPRRASMCLSIARRLLAHLRNEPRSRAFEIFDELVARSGEMAATKAPDLEALGSYYVAELSGAVAAVVAGHDPGRASVVRLGRRAVRYADGPRGGRVHAQPLPPAVATRLVALWRSIVDPWLREPRLAALAQNAIVDLALLAAYFAQTDRVLAYELVTQWDLVAVAPMLEPNASDAIVDALEDVLASRDQLTEDERERLVGLLDALVSVGVTSAARLAERLADER